MNMASIAHFYLLKASLLKRQLESVLFSSKCGRTRAPFHGIVDQIIEIVLPSLKITEMSPDPVNTPEPMTQQLFEGQQGRMIL